MYPGRQKIPGNGMVILGGYDDADGINLADKLAVVAVGACAECGCNFRGPFRIVIYHSDQFDTRNRSVFLGMEVSQITNSYDGGSQGTHPRQIPRLEFSIKVSR